MSPLGGEGEAAQVERGPQVRKEVMGARFIKLIRVLRV